jgi:CIC family chloride channel protein
MQPDPIQKLRETSTAGASPIIRRLRRALPDYFLGLMPEGKRYWLLVPLTGVVSGLIAVLLQTLLELVQHIAWNTNGGTFRSAVERTAETTPWAIFMVLTAGGAFFTLLRLFRKRGKDLQGTPAIIEALAFRQGRLPIVRTLADGLGSIIGVGMGASLGREGGMINSGGALGSFLGDKLRLEDHHVKILLACGAAGGMAAAYNIPIGASVFAMEVLLASLAMELFGPIILCSVIATIIARTIQGSDPTYAIPAEKILEAYKLVSAWEIFLHLGMGVILGLVSVAFIRIFSGLDVFFRWLASIDRIKPLVAMTVLGAAGAFVPDILGNGFDTVQLVLAGQGGFTLGLLLVLCILKILATALCRAGGIPGGLFTPSLFVGAMLGCAFGTAVNRLLPEGTTADPGAYALVGMGAILAGTIHAPITAVLIIFEMTQDYAIILPLMAASIASAAVSHVVQSTSIYTEPLRRRGIHVPSALPPTWIQEPTVESVLNPDVATVSPAERFEKVMDTFLRAPDGQDHLYVTSRDGAYLGTISLHEIKLFFRETENLESVIAADLVNTAFPSVYAGDPVSRAVEILARSEAERLPVLDAPDTRRLLGTVSKRMLLSAYTEANLPHRRGTTAETTPLNEP